MRIAIVAPHAGYVARGAERWAFELWRCWEPNCRVFSLAATEWTSRVKGFRRDNAAYQLYLKLIRPLTAVQLDARIFARTNFGLLLSEVGLEHFTFAAHLFRALEDYAPDVVFACAGPVQANVIAKYCREFNVPFVAVSGTGNSPTTLREARSRPDAMCVQTPSAKTLLNEHMPDLFVECVPNGVDIDSFSPDGARFTIEEIESRAHNRDVKIERPIYFSISALDIRAKRIDALISAVARLPEGALVLASSGRDKKAIIEHGDASLGARFAYIGELSNEDVVRLTNTGDVTGLFSPREAFGTVLIEAMAAGKPVVANLNEDTKWIVGENGGILTDVLDDAALSSALQLAAYRDWGDGPRTQALRFGSWETIASRYLQIATDARNRRARARDTDVRMPSGKAQRTGTP